MEKYYITDKNEFEIKYTIKEILANHWYDFMALMEELATIIRESIIIEVEKVSDCQKSKQLQAIGFDIGQAIYG